MMTAEQLKNSIYQLAIQGKLVEQRCIEGYASDLIDEIVKKKKSLLDSCTIKPIKGIEPIDEVPFDIPDNWAWVRLGSIATIISDGTHKTPKYVDSGIPFLSVQNISQGHFDMKKAKYITIEEHQELIKRCKPEKDDILVCRIGTLGKAIKVTVDFEFSIFVSLGLIRLVDNQLSDYIISVINSGYGKRWIDEVKVGGGTHTNKINLRSFPNLLIPLPPIEEQKRILNKLDEFNDLILEYEETSNKLNTLNTTFPDQMKKSILQQAVMGKLVPQDPNDEPASVLLEKIAKEKKRLIKEGKIKKQKKLPEITEDEIPFDIPENWMWTRMGDIVCLENGDRSSKYPKTSDYVESGVPFFGAKDMIEGILSFDNTRFITQKKYDELGNGKLQNGDLVCLLRGSVGKTVEFCANDLYKTGFICAQMVIIRLYDLCLLPYAKIVLESPYYKSALEAKITGTAVKQLPASEIFNMLIPIPPINEQCRICDRVKELMKIMESLRSRQ